MASRILTIQDTYSKFIGGLQNSKKFLAPAGNRTRATRIAFHLGGVGSIPVREKNFSWWLRINF